MKMTTKNKYFRYLLVAAVFCLSILSVQAQYKTLNKTSAFCSRVDLFNNGSGVTTLDLRESTLPARKILAVDVKRHGSISIHGEDRSDILVRSCVQTWGNSDASSRALARRISIETNSVVHAESTNPANDDNNVWSFSTISYEILVPRATNLNLSTWNGNISIRDVTGKLGFKALNGNLSLMNLAGDVHGRTTNGNVSVGFLGGRWMGEQLDIQTTNGGIYLDIPKNYAANLEIGTGSGTFDSNVDSFQFNERPQALRLNKPFNGGGAPVRITTLNGSVRIMVSEQTAGS